MLSFKDSLLSIYITRGVVGIDYFFIYSIQSTAFLLPLAKIERYLCNENKYKSNIKFKMAKPLEPLPVLKGRDALNFLREKDRIESLKPSDKEYRDREKFFARCRDVFSKVKFSL